MLKRALLFSLVALAEPLVARAGSPWVRSDLATMVEEVVADTGISINISESTPTSVGINQVNGRLVCSPEARADVESLQRAFDRHPNIYRNVGPILATVTDRTGKKATADPAQLEKEGIRGGCSQIYVSVHEQPLHAAQQGAAADLAPLGRFARPVGRRPGGPGSSRARPPVVASWFAAPGS